MTSSIPPHRSSMMRLRKKCTFKGIPFPTAAALSPLHEELVARLVRHAHATSSHRCLPLRPSGANFRRCSPGSRRGRQPAIPAAFPLSAGDIVIRPPAGAISVPGMASSAPIEVIRFAASNRLCVELDYVDEQGKPGVRVIEPYSLRRTQAGDIVLHAVRADNQQHRSYRIDRIRGARATQRSFTPRYAVELTPTGPISTPPAAYTPRLAASGGTARRRGHSGPTYVYQCGLCGKRFERSKRDSNLRPHKNKNEWPCSGRHGVWVDTKW